MPQPHPAASQTSLTHSLHLSVLHVMYTMFKLIPLCTLLIPGNSEPSSVAKAPTHQPDKWTPPPLPLLLLTQADCCSCGHHQDNCTAAYAATACLTGRLLALMPLMAAARHRAQQDRHDMQVSTVHVEAVQADDQGGTGRNAECV